MPRFDSHLLTTVFPLVVYPIYTSKITYASSQGSNSLRGRKIAGNTAAVVERHLSALLASPVQPLRGKDSRIVSTANIAPHDLRIVIVCELVHLRQLHVRHEVLHGSITRVGDGLVGVWIDIREAEAPTSPAWVSRVLILEIVGMVPFWHAEVCTTADLRLILGGSVEKVSSQVTNRTIVRG
jgi:hypothetical protein